MGWTIYNSTGTTAKAVAYKMEYNGTYKGDRYLAVTITSPYPISFAVGDKLTYRGEEYVLTVVPTAKRQSADRTNDESLLYDSIRFKSAGIAELQHTQFTDLVLNDNNMHYTALGAFSFYVSKLSDFGGRLLACLNEAYGNGVWTIAYGDGASGGAPLEKDFDFAVSNDTSLWNALVNFSNKSGKDFTVVGRTITLGSEPVSIGHTFVYGKGNGLKSLTRTQDADQRIITRLKAYGSSRNLPYRYYNKQYEVMYAKAIQTTAGVFLVASAKWSDWVSCFGRSQYAATVTRDVVINGTTYSVDPTSYTSGEPFALLSFKKHGGGTWSSSEVGVGDKILLSGMVDQLGRWTQYTVPDEKMVSMYVPSLMLPGFPEKSLAQWVAETAAGDSEWAEDVQALIDEGFTFSTDKYLPCIYAPTLSEYGQRDGEVIFDGSDEDWEAIYPTTSGEVLAGGSQVSDNGTCSIYTEGDFEEGTVDSEGVVMVREFTLTMPDMGFNPWDNRVDGETPMIEVTSGMCQSDHGKFEITDCQKDTDVYRLTCRRVYDSAINMFYPNNVYQVASGDSFILTGITMPDELIAKASVRLLLQACEWLKQKDFAVQELQVEIDDIFMANNEEISGALTEGCLFPYQDISMGIALATNIVQQLVIREGDGDIDKEVIIPHYEISLAQDVEATLIDVQTAGANGGSTILYTGGTNIIPGGEVANVVQQTGTSVKDVMSQSAVTKALDEHREVFKGQFASATLERTYKFVYDDESSVYRFVVMYNGETFSTGDITNVVSLEDLVLAITSSEGYNDFCKTARMELSYGQEDVEVIIDEELVDIEGADVLTVRFWSGTMSPDLPSEVHLFKGVSHVNTLSPLDYPKDNDGTGDKEFFPLGRTTYFHPEKRRDGAIYMWYPENPSEGYTLWTWNGSEYVPLSSNVEIEIDDEPVEGGENAISSGWAYTAEQAIEGKVDKVLATFEFSNLIGTSSNQDFYFATLKPTDYYKPVRVRYKIDVNVSTNTNYVASSFVDVTIVRSAVNTYAIYNAIYSTSYRPYYYHLVYLATSVGASDYGHLLGFSLRSSKNPTSNSYKRSGKIAILEVEGGTLQLLDSLTAYADAQGTGDTNYSELTELNGYSKGLQETGDTNTTYTNASLGQGYGTCSTAASTAAKEVTLASYALTLGGIVSVKFDYDVCANATMSINGKDAKAIYYHNAPIEENAIKAGDIATFIYSTYYHVISIDRGGTDGREKYPSVYDETHDQDVFPDGYLWVYSGEALTGDDLDANAKSESDLQGIGLPSDFFTGLVDGKYDGFCHGEAKTYGTSPNTLIVPECVLRLVGYEHGVEFPVDNSTYDFDVYLFRSVVRKSNRAGDYGVDIQIMYRGDSAPDYNGYWILAQKSSTISVDSALSSTSENPVQNKKVYEALQGKQNTLVSGTNIATINGNNLLNGGDIVISGGTSLVTYNCVQIFNTPIGQDLVSPYLTEFTIDDMLDDIRDHKANLVITSSFNLPSYSSNPTKVTFSFVLQQGGSKKDYSFVLFYDEIDEYNERSVRHFVTIIDDRMGHWEVASKDEAYRHLNDDDRPMTTSEINAILV